MDTPRSFHLHTVSDATGETLAAIAKAARVQYGQVRAIEHHHPLVRSQRELVRVIKDIEASPGIVLYTIFNKELAETIREERVTKTLTESQLMTLVMSNPEDLRKFSTDQGKLWGPVVKENEIKGEM